MRFRALLAIFLAVLHVAAPDAWSQAPTPAPEDTLPIDPAVTVGRLPNGLRYYIRPNRRPEKRAELRLVVNAGSILEDDGQRGLAHFVEHMAFNGTKRFPKQALVDYLESIGMRFGPDLNAYTSFDETVYLLQVPTDSAHYLETAFQILGDWARNQSFDRTEIEKERGVVIEEWRIGQGAGARIRSRQLPVLFQDSRYAVRLPIGEKSVLESFDPSALERFYADWYRPDLMAVIAVGDFDVEQVERLIRQEFGAIPAPTRAPERPLYPVPDHTETRVAIATDPEATASSVGVYYKLPPREEGTVRAFRQRIVEQLYDHMLNERLAELVQKPDPPFIAAGAGHDRLVRTREAFSLAARTRDNAILRGLEALLTEAERLRRHGFTASELERAKADLMRALERAFAEREKTESRIYAAEYVAHFLEGEPIPGIAYEYELYQRLLPGIELEEVNRLTAERITEHNRVVLVSAPEKERVEVPTEEQILAVFEAVARKEIPPYVDSISDAPLIAEVPAPGAITRERRIPEVGVIEWTLANGARVLVKPTDFKADEILFRATSPGGTSLASDADHVAATTAASVVPLGGLGRFDRIQLQKKLAGKSVSVSPTIGSLEEGLSGRASPRDVETLFQLIHLYFTAPRPDSAAFLAYHERLKASLANRHASPEAAFQDTIQATLTQYHYRARTPTPELVEEMDLEKSFAFYRDRFADASDFTFIFVGSFDPDSLKPLVQTYLGSLPSIRRKESWRDEGIRPPKGVVRKIVRRGIEPKALTQITFTGSIEYTRERAHLLSALAQVLEIRLRERLREDLGGTYGVNVSAAAAPHPYPQYSLTITFGSAPERVEELTGVLFEELESLKTHGPRADELAKVKELQRREWETNLKQNSYWLAVLLQRARTGADPRRALTYDRDLIEPLTARKIQEAAKQFLRTDNYVQVSLLPEAA